MLGPIAPAGLGPIANWLRRYLVYATSFDQSLGSELLTNGDFSSWSGDNPTGWTVLSESGADPEVTQRAANQGHAGSGTGAANLYTTATANAPILRQTVFVAGNTYEASINVSNFVSGSIYLRTPSGNVLNQYSSAGIRKPLLRPLSGDTVFQINALTILPTDITIDDVSLKLITLNTQYVAAVDGTFYFEFTPPASPIAGQRIELRYRVVDTTNYWVLYLLRNDTNTNWDLRADTVVSGTATNRRATTNVGSGITAIEVVVSGTTHTFATYVGTTRTQQGTALTLSTPTLDSAANIRPVWHSAFTPSKLTAR